MKPKGFKLNPLLKLALLISIAGLFISGISWIITNNFFYTESDYGITPSPLEPVFLSAHGFIAPIFLIAFGALFPTHISKAYKANANLKNGLSLLAIIFILIITGYLLYYAGGDGIRRYSSLIHSVLGVIFIPLTYLHIQSGKKFILNRKNSKSHRKSR